MERSTPYEHNYFISAVSYESLRLLYYNGIRICRSWRAIPTATTTPVGTGDVITADCRHCPSHLQNRRRHRRHRRHLIAAILPTIAIYTTAAATMTIILQYLGTTAILYRHHLTQPSLRYRHNHCSAVTIFSLLITRLSFTPRRGQGRFIQYQTRLFFSNFSSYFC